MADDTTTTTDDTTTTPATPDLSFIPETFKAEDGSYKIDEFSAHVSELSEFKTAADERAAALPKEASAYAFAPREDHKFLDGFNPADFLVPVLNEEGEPVLNSDGTPQKREMTAADMVKSDDPDLPALQEAMLKHQAPPELMNDLASILANRELRSLMEAGEIEKDEKAKLGPDGQTRLDKIKRAVEVMVPRAQSDAILDGVTSADALRGLETLIQKAKIPPSNGGGSGFDMEAATNKELIAEGMRRQMAGK